MEQLNRKSFYDKIRQPLFNGIMKGSQVEGIEAIIDEFERRELKDLRWLGYILATAYHETAKTMQPIEEYGKGEGKIYGKINAKTGKGYWGRGHTQNTWLSNYTNLTNAARKQGYDWDFINKPELLLEMKPSIWATFYGMLTGLYTGKALDDYFNQTKDDPINARRIINILDKAQLIAGYHKTFLNAFS